MKKTIKKLLVGISTVSVLTTCVLGTFSVTASSLDDYILLDDKGMFYSDNGNYQMYYLKGTSKEMPNLHKLIPILYKFVFVLDKDVSCEEVNDKIIEIIEEYYPKNNLNTDDESQTDDNDIAHISLDTYNDGTTYYTVSFSSEIINDPEDERVVEAKKNSKAIMCKLNDKNLISAFYDIGDVYRVESYEYYQYFSYSDSIDIELVEKFIKDNNLACTMEKGLDIYDSEAYSLVATEEISFEEYFSIATDLYEEFGLEPELLTPDISSELYDINSLEITVLSGDANGDSKIDVSDCAFIARTLAKREVIDVTTNPAADYNQDGKVNVSDAATIARDLAKKDL